MSKIFVVPEIPGSSLIRIQLKHPKDWSDCNFYIDPQEGRIYELSTQQNSYYSWFLNDNLINDGNMYLVTSIDPIFLLIPFIYKNTERFHNLFDIFTENNILSVNVEQLQKLYLPNILKCIADVKDFEDEVFIKFSIEKTLKWLSLKFETIKKSLIDQGIGKNLFGFKISDYVSGNKFSEDEYKVLSFELIADYICPDLEQALRRQLSIPDRNALSSSAAADKPAASKRKLDCKIDHEMGSTSAHMDGRDREITKESNSESKVKPDDFRLLPNRVLPLAETKSHSDAACAEQSEYEWHEEYCELFSEKVKRAFIKAYIPIGVLYCNKIN